jgi:hypothetical protein
MHLIIDDHGVAKYGKSAPKANGVNLGGNHHSRTNSPADTV